MTRLAHLLAAITLGTITLGAGALAAARPADPTAGGGGVGALDTFGGEGRYDLAIAVPAFHGLEPSLALAYHSSGGNGWLGVGWSLTGLGVIERTSPDGGAPAYDDAVDGFRLDGVPLVACRAGSTSPSCVAGGNYATRIESFQKILFDRAANTWTVWQRNGTRSVYREIYWSGVTAHGAPTYKYGLSSVSDPHGNTVAYTWSTNFAACCWAYPQSIAYNGNVVDLRWEARPDPEDHANGGPAFEATPARIKTIEVHASGQPLRAYKLDYITSPMTGRSVLAQVQLYGRDYTLDASGGVTGGSALPATRFTTQAAANSYAALTTQITAPLAYGYDLGWETVQKMSDGLPAFVADLDGDGKLDEVILSRDGSRPFYQVSLNGASGAGARWDTPTPTLAGADPFGWTDQPNAVRNRLAFLTLDLNGDGKTDVVTTSYRNAGGAYATGYSVDLSTGTGFVQRTCPSDTIRLANDPATGIWGRGFRTVTGDFNGDGRQDIATLSSRGETDFAGGVWGAGIAVDLGTTAGCPVSGRWASATPAALRAAQRTGAQVLTGDFNGDGKTDLLTVLVDRGVAAGSGFRTRFYLDLSTGNGFSSQEWTSTMILPAFYATTTGELQLFAGDFDGDGKTDLAATLPLATTGPWATNVLVELSTGRGFRGQAWPAASLADLRARVNHPNAFHAVSADFNGDGKADLGFVSSSFPDVHYLALSTGAGFQAQAVASGLPAAMRDNNCLSFGGAFKDQFFGVVAADFDGDGRADLGVRGVATCGLDAAATTFSSPWSRQVGSTYPDLGYRIDLASGGRTLAATENAAALPDLVTRIDNGLGGTLAYHYTPSSVWPGNNYPGVLQTLDALTQLDGRGGTATHDFRYAGALFDRRERQFLGFHYSQTLLPQLAGEAARPYHEIWFHQGYGFVARPEREDVRDASGALVSSTLHAYTVGTTSGTGDLAQPPFTQFETSTSHFDYDPVHPASFRQTQIDRVFDAWGNVSLEADLGDVATASDDRWTYTSFVANPAAFLVGLPGAIDVYAGPVGASAHLALTLHGYDGASSWTQAPALGDVTTTWQWLDRGDTLLASATSYDAAGNPISTTDPTGATARTTYDPSATYPIAQTDALLHTSVTDWDPVCGVAIRRTDPNGARETTTYDALCRSVRVDSPLGGFHTTSYERFGDPAHQRVVRTEPSADGVAPIDHATYFDGLGRTWSTIDDSSDPRGGREVDVTFDARGNLATRTLPYFAHQAPSPLPTEQLDHDVLGRPTAVHHADGKSRTTSYPLGGTINVDEVGHQQADYVDARGRVTLHQEWQGGTLVDGRYTGGSPASLTRRYDARGNLDRVIDAGGNVSSYVTDSLGRVVERTDPDLGTWSFGYDAAGRVTQQVDASGQTVWTTYDLLGRKTHEADGQTIDSWFAYDQAGAGAGLGRMTSMIDRAGQTVWIYDAAGRVTSSSVTTAGRTLTTDTAFDAGGRVLGRRYPDGDLVGCDPHSCSSGAIAYDVAGHVARIPGIVDSATYDAAGQLTSHANHNGTVTRFAYDPSRGFGTEIATTGPENPEASPIQRLAFTRDPRGLLTQVTASGLAPAAWSFAYTLDESGRLTSATTPTGAGGKKLADESYVYDAAGRVMVHNTTAYGYPATGAPHPHAAILVGGAAYTYDANGNMLTGGGRSYAWDARNRPTSITAGGATTTFAYNGLGQRVQKVGDAGTTLYVGDDYEERAGVSRKTIRLADRVVAERDGTITSWLHADQLGSIQARTDASGHVVDAPRAYLPYGGVISGAIATVADYTGERRDPETGLVYLHARYYDPSLLRFVSADPSVPTQDLIGKDHYHYAHDNPVDYHDRSGLAEVRSNAAFTTQQGTPTPAPGSPQFYKDKLHAGFPWITFQYDEKQRAFTADELDLIYQGLDLVRYYCANTPGLGVSAFDIGVGAHLELIALASGSNLATAAMHTPWANALQINAGWASTISSAAGNPGLVNRARYDFQRAFLREIGHTVDLRSAMGRTEPQGSKAFRSLNPFFGGTTYAQRVTGMDITEFGAVKLMVGYNQWASDDFADSFADAVWSWTYGGGTISDDRIEIVNQVIVSVGQP